MPLVSGLNTIEAKTEAAATVVPIIIGIAKPMCHSVAKYDRTGPKAAKDRSLMIAETSGRRPHLGRESLG